MARRSKTIKPRPLYVPPVAAGAAWIAADRYDRRMWSEILATAPALRDLVEAGDAIAPHFSALIADLFAALYKMNVRWNVRDDVRRAAALNRTILDSLIGSAPFEVLRLKTALEEDRSAIGAMVMGGQALDSIRAGRLANERELRDLWDLANQEDDLGVRADTVKAMQEMIDRAGGDDLAGDAEEKIDPASAQKMAEAAERAAKVSEARLNQKSRYFESDLEHRDRTELSRMKSRAAALADEIERAADDAHDFSREFGQGARMNAGARLDLGARLAKNRKLGELARMVGRMKLDARAIRRRSFDRGAAQTYDIERGAEIGRLVASELLSIHHPALRRDFNRRILESSLLQYRIRDDEERGRGPMFVCIDVSGSMAGDKELWAKAVGLTLMDIARRGRRLFRAVLFSSGGDTMRVIDLNRERRYEPDVAKVIEMAEYFAGGGTDFEQPLDTAIDLLETKGKRRGDIVIITDGECRVSPEWLAAMNEKRDALDFKIFAVLVDVGASELESVAQFADQVTSVRSLTDDSTREIFLKVQT
jgi:uncharacterized protein with von Willebrand factor type A (vWA) domain